MHKTFSIKTLGCKLNQYETSIIAGQFTGNGWISKPFGEQVDLVIINTCTVTNKSDKKCRNYIRQGAAYSKTGKVLVTGCLAETKETIDDIPEIFAIVKNSDKDKIFSVLKDYSEFISDSKSSDFIEEINKPLPFFRTRGLIKIQDGCDGKCAYCIVPTVRGNPVSRNFPDAISHAKKLVDSGCPELILTGITIGKYSSENKSLSDLIKAITDIDGNFRVRITSIEPNHVTDSLIEMLSLNKVCPHIHIPVQAGSDSILKMMNRPYIISDYMRIIDKIKKVNEDISIGTDIIIGFPGETEEDFSHGLNLIEQVKFAYVHQFTFSQRTGTPAASMKTCQDKVISERAARMRDISSITGIEYKKRFIGRSLPSIIEKNKNREGYKAVSDNYIKINIHESVISPDKTGKIINVNLKSVEKDKCVGSLD